MEVTHLEVRRHPTWQEESRHSMSVPDFRVLHAERQRRRLIGVGALIALAALAVLFALLA